jgi:endonuclease/exonuclease/phosphatase family metal-dependent hydrolase
VKRVAWILVAVAVVAWLIVGMRCRDDDVVTQRFATFNIENFPKDARQIDGAFAQIAELGASFVAVQEISEPGVFAFEAERRLGAAWEFVHLDTAPWTSRSKLPMRSRTTGKSHHNGVVFDTRVWTLVSTRSHSETRIGERHKPTFEVRLRPVAGGAIVRVLVVHLKSGGANEDIRERQLRGLAAILAKGESDEPTILLGDFNATGDRDRNNLAALAAKGRVQWATRDLSCSAFWSRETECPRSRLDHVFTTRRPLRVEAAGACATHGCEATDSCPVWADHVSDHCPVVVTIER